MGIAPGKIGAAPRLRSMGRAGGFVGGREARHASKQGRAGGFVGRGNDLGAGPRPTDLDDLVLDAAGDALVVLGALPEIHTTNDPTYSEFLEAYPSPIGGGEILFSGTDPVDPRDCDLYPDSPLCGGSVLDPGAIGPYGPLPISGGLEFSVSPTETLISVNASLFGVPLPPLSVGFRKEGAQEAVEDFWRQPPPTITDGFQQTWGNPGSSIYWIVFQDFYANESELASVTPPRAISQNHENVVYSHIPPEHYSGTARTDVRRWARLSFSIAGGLASWEIWKAQNPGAKLVGSEGFVGFTWTQGQIQSSHAKFSTPPPAGFNNNPDYPPYGEWKRTDVITPPDSPSFQNGPYEARQGVHPLRVAVLPYQPPPPPPPPPPLPPRSPANQPEDPMACDCKKLEELLKKILALLDHSGEGKLNLTPCVTDPDNPPEDVEVEWAGKGLQGVFQALSALTTGTGAQFESTKCVAPRLGVESLPWNLPASLGRPPAADGSEDEGVTVETFAALQLYHFQQLSEMLGQTEIAIKIADSNLTEEGDQEVTLKFANISEALAEIAGMALSGQSIGNATLKAAMTAVAQSGMAATSAATANQHAEEIQDFLGYEVKRDSFEMPLAYTPGESAPDKMLVPSTAKLSYWNNTDKTNLQSHMATMEFAAAIIRAALYERIGDEITGPNTIKDRVKETVGEEGSDFSTFLDRVEQGFTDAAGNTEQTPYGRPFNERPRIRKIGNQGGDDGSNT